MRLQAFKPIRLLDLGFRYYLVLSLGFLFGAVLGFLQFFLLDLLEVLLYFLLLVFILKLLQFSILYLLQDRFPFRDLQSPA